MSLSIVIEFLKAQKEINRLHGLLASSIADNEELIRLFNQADKSRIDLDVMRGAIATLQAQNDRFRATNSKQAFLISELVKHLSTKQILECEAKSVILYNDAHYQERLDNLQNEIEEITRPGMVNND